MEEKNLSEEYEISEEINEDEDEDECEKSSDVVGKLLGCGALITTGIIIGKWKNNPKRLERQKNKKEDRLHKAEIRNDKYRRIKDILMEKDEFPKLSEVPKE